VPISLFPVFLLYAAVCEISPGPVNLYALSCGLRYRYQQLYGYIFGMLAGFSTVMAISVVLTLTLGELLQNYVGVLSYIGAAYILYLAWNVLRDSGELETGERARPTFRTGYLLQISNIKTFLFCVTTLSSYVLPYTRAPLTLLIYGTVLPVTGVMSTMVWLFSGSALRRFLLKYRKIVNVVMALLLVVCAVQLVIT